MTSQIITSTIDEAYPVAGQDNDSQGFRDNFSNIKTALETASSEITSLQTNSILAANLTTNDPVANDLQGSSINNGYYNNFHGVAYANQVSAQTDIDVTAASIQVFTLTTNVAFTFRNWPENTYYGVVRVHFVGNGNSTYTPTIYTEGGGNVVKDNNFPGSFTVGTDGKHQVIEAWTYNGGSKVFVKYLGEF